MSIFARFFEPAYPVRRRVVVTLKSDPHTGFNGLLWEHGRMCLVLKGAKLLDHTRETVVDGDVVVDRANVAYMQVLGAE